MKSFLSRFFSRSALVQEQILAYRHKLPSKVAVSWERRNDLIIGEIVLDEKGDDVIYTQAKNANEFVKMVNDAVYVAYDLKPEYIKYFHTKKECYKMPPQKEWEKLRNSEIHSGKFGVVLSSEKELVVA
jgi:hypothetical protein